MKKVIFFMYVIIFTFLSGCNSCGTSNIEAVELYNEFLDGKISVDGINIDYITIPTGESDRRYTTKYTFFDSNGDKIPELHIKSERYYYVFTVNKNKLEIWANLSPYPYCYPLNNRAFMWWKCGSAPMFDVYIYELRNFSGERIFDITFEKYDKNQNDVYDENDEFIFAGVKVTKEIWESLTEKYLYINENGIEDISNKIDTWTVIYE